MLGTTISITVNAVAKVLKRVSDPDAYAATYFLADTDRDYTLSIKHTVPKQRGASKESHLVRLDVDDFDSTTHELTRRQSVWVVLECSTGRQLDTDLNYFAQAIFGYMTSTNTGYILGRDS